MSRLNVLPAIALALIVLAAPAFAEPYWVAWEGDTYPDDSGWQHVWGPQPAERWLEDGALVIDSLASTDIADFYRIQLTPGTLDPEPGELFVMEWRLRVDEIVGAYDVSVSVFSDDEWGLGFQIGANDIKSTFETQQSAQFSSGEYHQFQVRSRDMRDYVLEIDGAVAMAGGFRPLIWDSRVSWGDGIQGAASLTSWDFFRFGVVPEPATLPAFLFVASMSAHLRGRVARGRRRYTRFKEV